MRPPCLRARGSVLAGYYDCSTPNDACHRLWMPRTAARRHNTARRQLHRNISDRHAGGGEFPNYGFYLAGLPVRARVRETGALRGGLYPSRVRHLERGGELPLRRLAGMVRRWRAEQIVNPWTRADRRAPIFAAQRIRPVREISTAAATVHKTMAGDRSATAH